MTALPLARTPSPLPHQNSAPYTDEPVALLQLDGSDPVEAASAVYREVRRGRRVAAGCGRRLTAGAVCLCLGVCVCARARMRACVKGGCVKCE